MGFASFDVQAKKRYGVQLDDQGSEDFSLSASSSDEISSAASSDFSDDEDHSATSLNDMSSLLQQLPIKRGLSRHFEGKSQSFTDLSNVSCLEDLAKPEHPYNKKLKSCKSYVGLYGESQRSNQQMMSSHIIPKSASSRLISKKTSRGSCSSFITSAAKRNHSNNATRPPTHPPAYRSSDSQTPLFEAKDSLRCVVPFFTA
ncbi:hypothetical protein ACET3Z_015332 [Daucus carota]